MLNVNTFSLNDLRLNSREDGVMFYSDNIEVNCGGMKKDKIPSKM